jgi:hypothetical protein
MPLIPRPLLVLSVAITSSLLTAAAHADVTKEQCIDANANAQRLRLAGKLGAARQELLTCVDTACPGMVRDDCSRRLDEIDRAQPTLIVDVRNSAGNDLTDVRVKVDGVLLTERLDGGARRVDPGVHVFTIEATGQPAVTRTLVIQESEKGRRETIVAGASAVAPVSEAGSGTRGGGQRLLGLGGLGAGAVGVVIGSVFGVLADNAWHSQESACGSSSSCSGAGHAAALSDHSTLTTDGAVSTAAFIAGGALIAAGAVLVFTAPKRATSASRAVTIAPSFGPGHGSLGMQVRF